MDFVATLRRYLQYVAPSEEDLLPWEISADECRQVILHALHSMEQDYKSSFIHELHDKWMKDDRGVLLLRELIRGLHANLLLSRDEIERILPDGVLYLFDPHGLPMTHPIVVALEVDRLARTWWQYPVHYAHEIRATQHTARGICLTPLGRITLGLPDRDVVKWLLHVEVAQSPGRPQMLSRRLAADLLSGPFVTQLRAGDSSPLKERLEEMGILWRVQDKRTRLIYNIVESARPILEEIVQERESPFDVLVHALLDDETSRVLTTTAPSAHLSTYGLAAEGVARQARQYAHELGNLLGSLRLAVDDLVQSNPTSIPENLGERAVDLLEKRILASPPEGLDREDVRSYFVRKRQDLVKGFGSEVAAQVVALLVEEQTAKLERARERTSKIVERLSRMKDEMHEVAVRIPVTREKFDVGSALRDTVAAINGDGLGITWSVPPVLPSVLGYRQRFVLALTELLRNALRATEGRAADVRVEARIVGSQMVLMVEDNGRGVPKEHREAIFVAGFTSRPAGSGQGLALVREVVQKELRGEIACEESPLGGARFVIKLPLQSEVAE